jgi:predicted cupin superfamily sugar epimerase
MHKDAAYWIKKLQLSEHPEGGYYKETYRSPELIEGDCLPKRFGGPRCFSTAIYFLLEGDQFSAFHRIKSDEVWHFYTGSSLTLYIIHLNGELSEIKLGSNFEEGEMFQAVIKAGCWYGARVNDPNSYSLVGGTVAPGFDFKDFELAERKKLIELYPQHRSIIEKLTHN